MLSSDYPIPPKRLGERILRYRRVPHLFHERDYPWISRYHAEFERFVGRRHRERVEHFKGTLPFDFPKKKGDLVFHLLEKKSKSVGAVRSLSLPKEIRTALFQYAATLSKPDSKSALSKIAEQFSIPVSEVLESAFADLPSEKIIGASPKDLSPATIALRANLALSESLIGRSSYVEVVATGNIRRIVRQIKLRRLICEIKTEDERLGTSVLRVSGPLSIFGHTTIYGRAFAELLPLLGWCDRFTLSAASRLRGIDALVEFSSKDCLLPSPEPSRYDSQIESRFAKDFSAKALEWNLIREPDAFRVEGSDSLLFPDFRIEHRRNPKIYFHLEIIGFWTPEYLERKMERLERAGIRNLIICVDETLGCGDPSVPVRLDALGRVIRYRRKISVERVLELIRESSQAPKIGADLEPVHAHIHAHTHVRNQERIQKTVP